MLQLHLKDGVGTRTVGVGTGLAGRATLQPHADVGHDVLGLRDLLLSEADDVDLLLGVFAANNFLALIEQVVELAAVDLVEG